jgi:hypothetical protein
MPSNQIFISYKSENANDVRFFVERLMAAGATVWFAEYEVLAANYDLLQGKIDPEIESAIDASSAAIVFTNNRWAASEYCLKEIRWIIAGIPHDRIVQVCIPKEEQPALTAPALKNIETIEYRDGDTKTVLEFIGRRLNIPGLDVPPSVDTDSMYLTRFGPLRTGPLRRISLPPSYSRIARSHLFRFEGEIDSQKVCLDLNINPSCVGSRSVNSRIHGPRDDDARRRHQDPRRGDGVAGALARAAAHEPVAGHAVARAQAARREPVCLLPAGGWHRALV